MARELIAATLDLSLDRVAVDVTLEPMHGLEDLPARMANIASNRRKALELERQATHEAAELAKALVDLDIPLRDVGTVMGVSHQRAHQLVHG